MSQTQTVGSTTELPQTIGSLSLRASTTPIRRNHSLDAFTHAPSTPVIGEEFPDVQLSELLRAANVDELLRDLATLISERGVVFFRRQDLTISDQKTLIERIGRLSGKPASSGLHIHPLTEDTSPLGDEVSIINSERRAEYYHKDQSKFASTGWHSDITFEPVPSDYAILKVHTNPPGSGGDTLWASAYEAYSRLSPTLAETLEKLEAVHEASVFKHAAKQLGFDLRTGTRGSPGNQGDALEAIHPVIRVNPVTGWKGIFVNKGFTRRILGVTKDESDLLLGYLFRLVNDNHDLQVRFKWNVDNPPGIGDVAIWDNRSTQHTATFDYGAERRVGDRAVSIGEKPYFDASATSRREALGIKA